MLETVRLSEGRKRNHPNPKTHIALKGEKIISIISYDKLCKMIVTREVRIKYHSTTIKTLCPVGKIRAISVEKTIL